MSLTNEAREALTNHYNELAEELHIFHRELRNNGFDRDESMDIILTILANPATNRTKREAISKNRELIRERLERLKKEGTDDEM